MKDLRAFRTIILDFDGVILDSVALKTELFVRCYEKQASNEQKAAISDYQSRNGGIGRRDKFEYFERVVFEREPTPESVARLSQLYSEMLEGQIRACSLLPGAIEFLDRRVSEDISLYLVSGTLHSDLSRILIERDLTKYFKQIIGSPTRKSDAFHNIIELAGNDPESTLAIGDSITELEAATAVGIGFIGIVAPNDPNFFPANTRIFPDLAALNDEWNSP
jgi:phosphoglycolate phosphatase